MLSKIGFDYGMLWTFGRNRANSTPEDGLFEFVVLVLYLDEVDVVGPDALDCVLGGKDRPLKGRGEGREGLFQNKAPRGVAPVGQGKVQ